MNKSITWIVSYPKSGNTWFRVFLNNLLSENEEPVNINELFDTPIASRRFFFDYYSGINSSDLTSEEIDNLRPKVFNQIATDFEKGIYVKVHDAWRINSNGEELFPKEITKAVIYIIRNPFDIAVSLSHHNTISLKESILNMNNCSYSLSESDKRLRIQLPQKISSWSDHIDSWNNKSGLKVHVIKYEDMHRDSLNTFTSAVKYLGLNYSKEKIRLAIKNSSFHILQEQEKRNGFNERPIKAKSFFRSGKIGNWHLEEDKSVFNSMINMHKETMERFGYLNT